MGEKKEGGCLLLESYRRAQHCTTRSDNLLLPQNQKAKSRFLGAACLVRVSITSASLWRISVRLKMLCDINNDQLHEHQTRTQDD